MAVELLYEVWRITERFIGGEIKATEYVEDRWVPIDAMTDRPDNDRDLLWTPKSTSYTGDTIRSVP